LEHTLTQVLQFMHDYKKCNSFTGYASTFSTCNDETEINLQHHIQQRTNNNT
jgi:hypothetical protein